MAKGGKAIPARLQAWVETRTRSHRSPARVPMARALARDHRAPAAPASGEEAAVGPGGTGGTPAEEGVASLPGREP